jgi:hypothetical protein
MGQAKRRRETGEAPPERDLLETLLDTAEKHARRLLLEERQKELLPFYHLVSPDRDHDAVIGCVWTNTVEKDLAVLKVQARARQIGAIAALFMGEAWMVILDRSAAKTVDVSTIVPSQHADRVECVQIVATDGVRTLSRALKMVRETPDGRLLALEPMNTGEQRSIDMMGRLIDGIIPPKSVH